MKIVVTHPNLQALVDNDHVQVTLQDLSAVEKASCTSIHLADCMDYVPPNERDKLLGIAIERLRYGGELTVSGTDMYALGNRIQYGKIGLEQVNASLYGGRLSIDHLHNLIVKLESVELEIVTAKLDNLYYAVTARRKDG